MRRKACSKATLQELTRYWGTEYEMLEGPGRVAGAWAELMNRLGYTRYVAQGGDQGASVVGPLTDPTSHGGRAEDAFDLVLPVDTRLWLLRRAKGGRLGRSPSPASRA